MVNTRCATNRMKGARNLQILENVSSLKATATDIIHQNSWSLPLCVAPSHTEHKGKSSTVNTRTPRNCSIPLWRCLMTRVPCFQHLMNCVKETPLIAFFSSCKFCTFRKTLDSALVYEATFQKCQYLNSILSVIQLCLSFWQGIPCHGTHKLSTG